MPDIKDQLVAACDIVFNGADAVNTMKRDVAKFLVAHGPSEFPTHLTAVAKYRKNRLASDPPRVEQVFLEDTRFFSNQRVPGIVFRLFLNIVAVLEAASSMLRISTSQQYLHERAILEPGLITVEQIQLACCSLFPCDSASAILKRDIALFLATPSSPAMLDLDDMDVRTLPITDAYMTTRSRLEPATPCEVLKADHTDVFRHTLTCITLNIEALLNATGSFMPAGNAQSWQQPSEPQIRNLGVSHQLPSSLSDDSLDDTWPTSNAVHTQPATLPLPPPASTASPPAHVLRRQTPDELQQVLPGQTVQAKQQLKAAFGIVFAGTDAVNSMKRDVAVYIVDNGPSGLPASLPSVGQYRKRRMDSDPPRVRDVFFADSQYFSVEVIYGGSEIMIGLKSKAIIDAAKVLNVQSSKQQSSPAASKLVCITEQQTPALESLVTPSNSGTVSLLRLQHACRAALPGNSASATLKRNVALYLIAPSSVGKLSLSVLDLCTLPFAAAYVATRTRFEPVVPSLVLAADTKFFSCTATHVTLVTDAVMHAARNILQACDSTAAMLGCIQQTAVPTSYARFGNALPPTHAVNSLQHAKLPPPPPAITNPATPSPLPPPPPPPPPHPRRLPSAAADIQSNHNALRQWVGKDVYMLRTPVGRQCDDSDVDDSALPSMVAALPDSVLQAIRGLPDIAPTKINDLTDIIMDEGCQPVLRFKDNVYELDCQVDLEAAIKRLIEVKQLSGKETTTFKTSDVLSPAVLDKLFGPDNRMGLPGTLHRISAMRTRNGSISGLTYRVGRHLPGVAFPFQDLLSEVAKVFSTGSNGSGGISNNNIQVNGVGTGDFSGISATRANTHHSSQQNGTNHSELFPASQMQTRRMLVEPPLTNSTMFEGLKNSIVSRCTSILMVGRPGLGKTTLLRDMTRMLADMNLSVVVVDGSMEIGGCDRVKHPALGKARRMEVRHHQHETLIEAVQNHTPHVIVVDEIGTKQEVDAVRSISQRGVAVIGTAHGIDLRSLMSNPVLVPLLGGIKDVTLGDMQAQRRNDFKKTRLERAGAPAFTCLVEVLGRDQWRVHTNLAASVDRLLAQGAAGVYDD